MVQRPYSGSMTSPFGPRVSPGGIGSTNHLGEDGYGGPNRAPERCRVLSYGYTGGWGNLITLEGLQTGYRHRLAHNAPGGLLVGVGSVQNEGAALGVQGMTGSATGVHVHWETITPGGVQINPSDWLRQFAASPAGGGGSIITRKARSMNYFTAVDDSGKITLGGVKAIRRGYNYCQSADGVVRPVGAQESGALAFFGHPVAQWPASVIETLAINGGFAEHIWAHLEPRHTGRVLIGDGLKKVVTSSTTASVTMSKADRDALAVSTASLVSENVKVPTKGTLTLS